jgi:hypothetical protein
MIQSDKTVCATAGIAEAEGARYLREENNPMKWLGVHSTWRKRRLFDWSYLACSAHRSGDQDLATYAEQRRQAFEIK